MVFVFLRLLSLSIIPPGSNHTVANGRISFFFIKNHLRPCLVGLSGLNTEACTLKGHWFDSHSGHMPGLHAGPQLGVCEKLFKCKSLFSLPTFLSFLILKLKS